MKTKSTVLLMLLLPSIIFCMEEAEPAQKRRRIGEEVLPEKTQIGLETIIDSVKKSVQESDINSLLRGFNSLKDIQAIEQTEEENELFWGKQVIDWSHNKKIRGLPLPSYFIAQLRDTNIINDQQAEQLTNYYLLYASIPTVEAQIDIDNNFSDRLESEQPTQDDLIEFIKHLVFLDARSPRARMALDPDNSMAQIKKFYDVLKRTNPAMYQQQIHTYFSHLLDYAFDDLELQADKILEPLLSRAVQYNALSLVQKIVQLYRPIAVNIINKEDLLRMAEAFGWSEIAQYIEQIPGVARKSS